MLLNTTNTTGESPNVTFKISTLVTANKARKCYIQNICHKDCYKMSHWLRNTTCLLVGWLVACHPGVTPPAIPATPPPTKKVLPPTDRNVSSYLNMI